MSSLEDSDGAAPRKRAKGEKAEKRKGKVKKSAKHESELKRLQSYVNACGASDPAVTTSGQCDGR